MVSYKVNLVLQFLTCYVIVAGAYITQKERDFRELTDLLLGYFQVDSFLPKIPDDTSPGKWSDILKNVDNDVFNHNMDVNSDDLPVVKFSTFFRDLGIRKRINTPMSKRDPCDNVLLSGPVVRYMCSSKRNRKDF